MTNEEFIGKVAAEAVSNNITLRILQRRSIDKYAGWFDSNKKELVCAIKHKLGFEVLIHEYNHMRQFLDRHDFWVECDGYGANFVRWVGDDTKVPQKKVNKFYIDAIKIECDCERNSIKTIEANNLNVSVQQYAKNANAYLFSYNYALKHRKWPNGSIYAQEIIKEMPDNIVTVSDIESNKDIYKLYEKYC